MAEDTNIVSGRSYKSLELSEKVKVYKYIMENKTKDVGELTREIQEKFNILIDPGVIKRWRKKGNPRFDFLIKYLAQPTEADVVIEVTNLYKTGLFGPHLISEILKTKLGLNIHPLRIRGWLYYGKKPRITNLSPSKELATLAAAIVGDGSITTHRHLRPKPWIQKGVEVGMKDIEPILLIRDYLFKICGHEYKIRVKQRKYVITCYRRDLAEFLKDRDNVFKLLKLFPVEFIRMLFECDGNPSGGVFQVNDHGKRKIIFKAKIGLTNSDTQLLKAVQEQLNELGISSKIYLVSKAGEPMLSPTNGRTYIRKHNVYRLTIQRKESIIKFANLIGFISQRKKQRLEDITSIVQKYSETEAVEKWLRLYRPRRKGRLRYIHKTPTPS